MDEQRRKQAEAIADLRDQQGLTYKAISEKLQISPGKVSYLYQELQRRRRIKRYRELRESQNQISVLLPLTLGEGLVLQKVLSLFSRESSRYVRSRTQLCSDPDFVIAEKLYQRLSALDQKAREENRQKP